MVNFALRTTENTAGEIKKKIKAIDIDSHLIKTKSSTGVEQIQLFIDCAAILLPTIAAIVAPLLQKQEKIVVIINGKEKSADSEKSIIDAIQEGEQDQKD